METPIQFTGELDLQNLQSICRLHSSGWFTGLLVHVFRGGTQTEIIVLCILHGTPRWCTHLAWVLMMVALLLSGILGGLGENPGAVSYPKSIHAST